MNLVKLEMFYQNKRSHFHLQRLDLPATPSSLQRRALLSADGLLLPNGSVQQRYETADGSAIDSGELLILNQDHQTQTRLSATLGRVHLLEAPLPPEVLLDYLTETAYQLMPIELDRGLQKALSGHVFSIHFRYRPRYDQPPCFVAANPNGYFLLQMRELVWQPLQVDQPPMLPETTFGDMDEWEVA